MRRRRRSRKPSARSQNGANAIQLATNANGVPLDEPQFWPIFEVIAKSGKPILLHPSRTRDMPDYPTEKYSKYEICSVLGWPYETGVTLARLVFSGIMDRYPDLKVIAHHLGGVIPVSRRPRRPQLGSARRAHLGRGLRVAAEEPEEAPLRLFQGLLRRHRGRGRARRHGLRSRLLRRRPRAVCLRLPVRQGEGPRLHPLDHRGPRVARPVGGRPGEGSAMAMRSRCSGSSDVSSERK